MSDPFETCPDCGAGEGWCEEGACVHCGYDVFADSDVEPTEDDYCPSCGEILDDEDECSECGEPV